MAAGRRRERLSVGNGGHVARPRSLNSRSKHAHAGSSGTKLEPMNDSRPQRRRLGRGRRECRGPSRSEGAPSRPRV